jgi:hypothetical protein
LVSAGLYFAYLWPQVEPEEPSAAPSPSASDDEAKPDEAPATDDDVPPPESA